MNICTSILGVGPQERETGASVVDIEFIRHADLSGHAVSVILPKGRQAGFPDTPGIQILDGGNLKPGVTGKLKRLCQVWKILLNVYEKSPNTIFRVNSFFSSLLEILPLVLIHRRKLSLFIQFHHKDHNWWRNTLTRWIMKYAQVIVCPSHAAATELIDLMDHTPEGLHKVYHGVNEKFFVERIEEHGEIDKSKLKLLFVGHLEQRKNPAFLIELAEALYNVVPVELTIVGKGPELEQLKARCANQPWASSIVFANEVSDQEKLVLYARADAFIFPSTQEGFGLVLCEAMAAGVPVFAFNTSAMPEIVVEGTGFLVPVGDLSGMVSNIQLLHGHPEILNSMRKQAIEHARKNFVWASKVNEILSILGKAYGK